MIAMCYIPYLQMDDPLSQVLLYLDLKHLFSSEWHNQRHPKTKNCMTPVKKNIFTV